MAESERRRRRLRHAPPADTDPGPGSGRAALTAGVPDPEQEQEQAGRRRSGGEDRDTERGLRGLVGSGASQVSITAALRARDAARPTDDDLAEAERQLVVVRRNWVPRDDPSRGR